MSEDKKEVTVGKMNEMFKLTDERADEIIKALRHAQVDHGGHWGNIFKDVRKTVKGEGEVGFFGWAFARMYSRDEDESNPMKMLEHLLKH